MPSSRPASIRTAGDTRIPSAGALSHSRAASIDGIPKYVPVLDRRLTRRPGRSAPATSARPADSGARTAAASTPHTAPPPMQTLNATISPSPVFLNSCPPDAPIASRNNAKCSSRSSSARAGPTDVSNRVEPTRSVTRIAASSIESDTGTLPDGTSARREAASRPSPMNMLAWPPRAMSNSDCIATPIMKNMSVGGQHLATGAT